VGQEDEGGVGGSRTSVVFVQATRRVDYYGDSFRFLSVICVLRRRHDATSCGQGRVRTDQVQCDVCTAQYKLFNFSVNKFIFGVNTNNLGVNSYPNGVNPVSRVIQTIWCDCLSIVNITLFWCEQTIMVKRTLLV
jgi:hypothetical protein